MTSNVSFFVAIAVFAGFAWVSRWYWHSQIRAMEDENNRAINKLLAEASKLRGDLKESEEQRARLLDQIATESAASTPGRYPLLNALLAPGGVARIITKFEQEQMEGAIVHPYPEGINGLTEQMFNEILVRVELHLQEPDVKKRDNQVKVEVTTSISNYIDAGALTDGGLIMHIYTYMIDSATAHIRRVASGQMTPEYSRLKAWEVYGPLVAPRPTKSESDVDEPTTTH